MFCFVLGFIICFLFLWISLLCLSSASLTLLPSQLHPVSNQPPAPCWVIISAAQMSQLSQVLLLPPVCLLILVDFLWFDCWNFWFFLSKWLELNSGSCWIKNLLEITEDLTEVWRFTFAQGNQPKQTARATMLRHIVVVRSIWSQNFTLNAHKGAFPTQKVGRTLTPLTCNMAAYCINNLWWKLSLQNTHVRFNLKWNWTN